MWAIEAKGVWHNFRQADTTRNTGRVFREQYLIAPNDRHQTAEVAVESIRRWWKSVGSKLYPRSRELLIVADGGGSNGARNRLWKQQLPGGPFISAEVLSALRRLPSAPTWSFPPRPYTSHIRWITPDPLVAGRVFAAVEAGALLRSLDGGRTWEDRKASGPFDSHTLVMHRMAPDRLYSAAGDGFMHPGNGFVESSDGGEPWYRPGEGLQHHYLWSVAADPADRTTLVISAAHGPQQAHNP